MMQSNEVASGAGSCGAHLKQARIAAGLTHEDVAARLKMPLRVVRALEADDWSLLGAPVFVRGQLRSYARLLGVDIQAELEESAIAPVTPPTLVSHSHTPRYQHVFEQATRRAAYIAITLAIAVPVLLASRSHLSSNVALQSLDLPGGFASETAESNAPAARTGTPQAAERTPLVASMASIPRGGEPRLVEESSGLALSFRGESWVQVFSTDGEALEQGMFGAGDRLSFAQGEPGRVVLGDASVVDVYQAGQSLDLARFSRANVARFTLSSDGSLAPVED